MTETFEADMDCDPCFRFRMSPSLQQGAFLGNTLCVNVDVDRAGCQDEEDECPLLMRGVG